MSNGLESCYSQFTMQETIQRLQELMQAKGAKLFCVVDHAAEAAAAGLKMPATRVLIFGNPKAGTPVMLASPSAALDLPLKILLAEEPDGRVRLSWNDPAWLVQRHGVPAELAVNLAAAGAFARAMQAGG